VSHRLVRLGADSVETSGAARADDRFARDLLRVDIEPVPGGERGVSLYAVHLKSRRAEPGSPVGDNGAARRQAEAARARAIIEAEMASEAHGRFVVLGDFNEGVDGPAAALLARHWTDQADLVDALAGVTPRATYIGGGLEEAIDQIWLAPGLAQDALPGLDAGSATLRAQVLRGGVFEKASDHRPVKLWLRK